jgi:hypothetical protein
LLLLGEELQLATPMVAVAGSAGAFPNQPRAACSQAAIYAF